MNGYRSKPPQGGLEVNPQLMRSETKKETMTKKLFKLIDKLEQEHLFLNGALQSIKEHFEKHKDEQYPQKPMEFGMIETLKQELSESVNLVNQIIEEKNNA